MEVGEDEGFVVDDLVEEEALVDADDLLVVETLLVGRMDGFPSSPWSSFGSRLIVGQEAADDVVVVVALILHPRFTLVLTVLQLLLEPEVALAQETT